VSPEDLAPELQAFAELFEGTTSSQGKNLPNRHMPS